MDKELKILIVEDNELQRETIKDVLEGLDCQFFEAASGEEALAILKEEVFNAIILDIRLPGMDGIETFRRAKKIRAELEPVIILTAVGEINTAVIAGKLEVFHYIQKPYSREKLKDAVVKAVNWKPNFNKSLVKRCFKFGFEGCLYTIPSQNNLIFVGMPFLLKDYYKYAIKPVIESFKLISWRGDEDYRQFDITCKLCGTLQSCKFAIMDISDHNPNVMFEIGLAYGYGKKVILLKNEKTKIPTDLLGMLYVSYSDIDELRLKLAEHIKSILEE